MHRLRALLDSDKVRFVLAGGSTTVFSYGLYVLFLFWTNPRIAYAVSYVIGIVWSYSIQSVWVFRRSWSWKGLLSFPLVYALQAVLSFLLFTLFLDGLSMPVLVAPLITLVLMLPLTYLLGRAVIRRTSSPTQLSPGDRSS
jgi:putative flippase GtrA